MHLIDAQPKQLEDSIKAVNDFRLEWSPSNSKKGDIITHLPSELKLALENSWLVVEVRTPVKPRIWSIN